MHADFFFQLSPVSSSASEAPEQEFFTRLDRELRPRMVATLRSRGASQDLAEDVVSEILSECVTDAPRNLLGRFKGGGSMEAWLFRVAINRLISRQRRERWMESIGMEALDSLPCEDSREMEGEVQGIVSSALRQAIESLPARTRLLLLLRHGYGIPQNRLCLCWRSTPSKLSRALSSAREVVRERTLQSIQSAEPGLQLEWQDISGVCAASVLFSETRHVA